MQLRPGGFWVHTETVGAAKVSCNTHGCFNDFCSRKSNVMLIGEAVQSFQIPGTGPVSLDGTGKRTMLRTVPDS